MSKQKTKKTTFLWGAAISAHQTEGRNRKSDWYDFERSVLAQKGLDVSGTGVDHWNRYEEDIALLKKAGLNAFRFSIEWAKIEPTEGSYNEIAIRHYTHVLEELKRQGITPCVTLWHFTLPAWAAKKGGMLNADVRNRFLAYVHTCIGHYANLADMWITMNEPMVYMMEGYRWGNWPPQIRSRRKATRVIRTLRKLHAQAYKVLKKGGAKHVGIAKHIIIFQPTKSASMFHRIQARMKHRVWNRSFFSRNAAFHDFIGINYYMTAEIGPKPTKGEKDDMEWPSNPQGLADALREVSRYKKPIYVTENGIATADDKRRVAYIQSHVDALLKEAKQGIDVRGYFYWSLLDNFEWAESYTKQFGLIAVNRSTMERLPKPSLKAYGALVKKGR